MASNFTAVNPKYIAPESLPAPVRKLDATDSKTWKKGEFCTLASGKVGPLSGTTGGTAVYGQFLEDQDTATSSSQVWVRVLQDGDRFELYVVSDGADAAIGVANIGTKYAIYQASNKCYLDTNVTSNAEFEVEKLAADYEPERNATADTPGKCIVKYHA